jgi:hypothetical protein
MDGLRWLLLLFGMLVVAGVYFYSRYQTATWTPTIIPMTKRPAA